ncbi:MAG: DUF4145 domain-containing protein [Solirubrobacteraceae bacterium]
MAFFGSTGRDRGHRGEDVPTADPDTAPDSSDLSGPCPRCGRVSNFDVLGALPVSFGGSYSIGHDGTRERDDLDRVCSLLCAGCGQASVVVEEKWIGDHPARDGIGAGGTITYRGIHWWPPPGSADLHDSIPVALRDGYAEALRALGARAPRAAVVMLRRTVEGLVKDRGTPGAQEAVKRNLAAGLQVMADEHILDANLAGWATEIRLAGNVGAHFDPLEDVSYTEADDLARLTRQLLHYVYELPAKLRRSRHG